MGGNLKKLRIILEWYTIRKKSGEKSAGIVVEITRTDAESPVHIT